MDRFYTLGAGDTVSTSDSAPSLVSSGCQSFKLSGSIAGQLGSRLTSDFPSGVAKLDGLEFGPADASVKPDLGPKEIPADLGTAESASERGQFQKPPVNDAVDVEEYMDGVLGDPHSNPPLNVEQAFDEAIRNGTEKQLVNDINAKLKRQESPYRVELGKLGPKHYEVRLFKQSESGQRELVDDCHFLVDKKLI